MKSLLTRGLACVVLLSSSVLVYAQSESRSLENETSRQSAAVPLGEYSTRTYGYDYRYTRPGDDDTMSCMALGCPGSEDRFGYGEAPIVDRTAVVELPSRGLPDDDLRRRLKEDQPPVIPKAKPRPKPKSEQAARDGFYRNLHRRPGGRG